MSFWIQCANVGCCKHQAVDKSNENAIICGVNSVLQFDNVGLDLILIMCDEEGREAVVVYDT